LPKLLGKHAMDAYEGYKSYIDPSIINEFTTIAFRFGHDQSSQTQQPLNEDGGNATPGGLTLFTLVTAFAAGADAARTTDDVDAWIRGQLSAYTQEIDGLVVDGNRNALFGTGAPFAVDLEVLDIMRARDHGVWNYNELRAGMGLDTYLSFDAYGLANDLDPARLAALKAVYGDDISKLDAIIGGLLEDKFYDSQLGETFTLLIAQQFENLRDGDRFYYEERLKHDPKLLAEIEATTLADILARTTGIDHIYRDAFAAHDRISDFDNDKKIEGSAKLDLVVGSDYGEVIKTYGGADDICGGKGNDKIFAGGGNDWIWTGDGKDILVFDDYAGHDVVKDFSAKYDKLDLTDYGIDSWKDARKIIKHSSDGIVLKLDDDTSVKLVGVKQLTTKNFIYDDAYDYGVA
jgi:peroxidase